MANAHHPLTRRSWLLQTGRAAAGVGALGLVAAGGGCGFKLRRHYDMAFKTIQLTGFAANSPLAAELARALEATGVNVVDSTLAAAQAASSATVPSSHIVLEGLNDRRNMVALPATAYGQIRDMTLRNILRFRVLRSDGTELAPAVDMLLTREMTYNERDALAKQDETEALHRAMQSDIVNQVMRRLAAIRPDQLIAPPAPPVPAVVHAPTLPAPAPASGTSASAAR